MVQAGSVNMNLILLEMQICGPAPDLGAGLSNLHFKLSQMILVGAEAWEPLAIKIFLKVPENP